MTNQPCMAQKLTSLITSHILRHSFMIKNKGATVKFLLNLQGTFQLSGLFFFYSGNHIMMQFSGET